MTRVVQIHDAAIDEYMATILLTTMEDVVLDGIVIVNADCIYGPAMDAAWKIQQYIDRIDIPLTLSKVRGFNPFPWPYRGDCIKQNRVAALGRYGPYPKAPNYPDGDAWLEEYLDRVTEQVTLLCLCPATPIADLLRRRPELAAKIEHMIWMAGAIDVGGNLDPTTLPIANPYAEWNVFWDPEAAQWLLDHTEFPITLFPLDITDGVPLTKEFMGHLVVQGKQYRYSDLAAQSWGIVSAEPFYDMWDVVATCYLTQPEFFKPPTPIKLRVATSGDKEGALLRDPDGREVDVILEFADADDVPKKDQDNPDVVAHAYYTYILHQFAR